MTKYRKSFGGVAIVVSIAMFLFVIVIVVSFFYFFKFQITLYMGDVYIWNRVQEVPLDLLSMDVDRELFVINGNKVYYGFLDREEFRDKIQNNINDQLFYFTGTENRPFGYSIWAFGMKIDEEPVGFEGAACGCTEDRPYTSNAYNCNDNCAPHKRGEYCGWWSGIPGFNDYRDDTVCFDTIETYQAEYPIPLTFNGTDKLVDEIRYKVVEYHV